MMKRIFLFLFALILPLTFASAAKAARSNFVVFQVDDMPRSLLLSSYLSSSGQRKPLMPNLKRYLIDQGSNFTDFAASSPTCAPSRASLLTGRYAHNTGLVNNQGSFGGALGWQRSPFLDQENLVNRLQEEGYKTAHFGKWLNQYGSQTGPFLPKGWDTWVSDATDKSTRDFYGYRQRWTIPRLGLDLLTEGIGKENYNSPANRDPASCRVHTASPGTCNYHSDLMSKMAADEIEGGDPFYIQIDYHAPHGDHIAPAGPQVATRHEHLLDKVILPQRSPNFNERDISDKSYLTRLASGRLRSHNISSIETFFRHAAVSLRAVDDGIGYIVGKLEKADLLKDTYLIFISDNGFFYGNHRFLPGKMAAYEESSKVPFLLRGPGVASGAVNKTPASTVDVAPTILDLAGARPLLADGQSLSTALSGASVDHMRPRMISMVSSGEISGEIGWNSPILPLPINPMREAAKPPTHRYRALQIGSYKYISYDRGGEELYDLSEDPFELKSLHRNLEKRNLLKYMRFSLAELRDCTGAECRVLANPLPEGY